MTELNDNLKRCSKGLDCCHPDSVDGWLNFSEFNKGNRKKDGLRSECRNCQSRIGYIYNSQLMPVLKQRVRSANHSAKNKWSDNNRLNYKQIVALLICQNYLCLITEIDLVKNLKELSLDHIIPNELSGLNIIENVIFIHRTVNLGKNGDYMSDALDTMLKIYLPNDSDKPLRDKRIEEIMNKIWNTQEIYPKVYEKIRGFTPTKLTDVLEKRLTVNDILNLS